MNNLTQLNMRQEILNNENYLNFVHDLHKSLKQKDIILVYEGEVDQSVTKAFTSLIERNLASSEESLPLKKKVYHVMVECLQNIYKHSDNMVSGQSLNPAEGIFIVVKDHESYNIVSGNAIYKNRLNQLVESIDHINSLPIKDLKTYHKQKLKESIITDKGGAGLGLIDIVKKTQNKIEYSIQPINELFNFLIVKFVISK
jgi:hypothetical protein